MKNLQLNLDEDFKEFVASRVEDNNPFYPENEGIAYRIYFPNGYGASVIKNFGSYGYEKDLWELALLSDRDGTGKWSLEYTELVMGDVLGYLSDRQVNRILKENKHGNVHEHINIYDED